MTIHEPATFATDCLLALLAAVLAVKLHAHANQRNASAARWLAHALGLLAISALIGGTYHGFAPEVPRTVATVWWWLTLLSLHGVSAAMGLSLIYAISPPPQQNRWVILVIVKLLGFSAFTALFPWFLVAVADYGSTMLLWVTTALVLRPSWWRPMALAVALSAVAAAVQQLRLAPSASFNHNDLYHVIQGLALVAFYQAGRRLPDKVS